MDPALDYSVEFREGKPAGMWVCALCYLMDVDVGVIKHKHSDDTMTKCRRCDAAFMNIIDLDDYYCSKHHEHLSVNCTVCGTLLPDTKSLKEHLK